MKLITEKALEQLEENYDCLITGDRYNLELECLFLSDAQFKIGEEKLKKDNISYTRGFKKKTLILKQSKLEGKVDMSEERVWVTGKGLIAEPTSEMSHQRISNVLGYLDLMLKKGKISKDNADDYLRKVSESIVPEINERFKGEILPYAPKFQWEFDMIKLPNI